MWPAVLLIFGAKRCKGIAIVGAIGCATYRFFNWSHYDHELIRNETQVRADALLVGCLIALWLAEPANRSQAQKWSKHWTFSGPRDTCLLYGKLSWARTIVRVRRYCWSSRSVYPPSGMDAVPSALSTASRVAWHCLIQLVYLAGVFHFFAVASNVKNLASMHWPAFCHVSKLLRHRTPNH